MRTRDESLNEISTERDGGRTGSKISGEGGFSHQSVEFGGATWGGVEAGVGFWGWSKGGPLRSAMASRIMLCNRCSWEDMNGAECRSPVHRVMSTQSRDWFRRVRRVVSG